MRAHSDFVRTPWGGYWQDPHQIEAAREMGRQWARRAIDRLRRVLAAEDQTRVAKRNKKGTP